MFSALSRSIRHLTIVGGNFMDSVLWEVHMRWECWERLSTVTFKVFDKEGPSVTDRETIETVVKRLSDGMVVYIGEGPPMCMGC